MKKKLFTLTLILFATEATAQVSINATNFPDTHFRNFLLEQIYGRDGKLTDAEIKTVNEIEVSDRPITSLKGIEFFTALTTLFCWNNQLTELDLSKNTKLTLLNCVHNRLNTLDLSKNTVLFLLVCDNNQLTSLDLSKNTKLTHLFCDNNQLTTLDLSKNTELTGLWCNNNLLTSLDVSKNIELETLSCYDNQLTSLDLSKNAELTELACHGNKIKGEKMQALVESLLTVEDGSLSAINTQDTDDQNDITKEQVKIAK
ncbi:MAG: leucine-rich repeat domain-containing protein, partial [Prevotella sp.]|nr:leucine-rich repeat domain-containing protein [Prevotella sp.]